MRTSVLLSGGSAFALLFAATIALGGGMRLRRRYGSRTMWSSRWLRHAGPGGLWPRPNHQRGLPAECSARPVLHQGSGAGSHRSRVTETRGQVSPGEDRHCKVIPGGVCHMEDKSVLVKEEVGPILIAVRRHLQDPDRNRGHQAQLHAERNRSRRL